jgi:hypothetical protein
MRLGDLSPRLMRIITPNKHYQDVDALADAQGVLFLCPKCFVANNGPIGTHSVLCWFLGRGVLDTEKPLPGRWNALGAGLHDLTLQAGSSSILLTGEGCRWHGFITNGAVTDA